MSVQVFRNDTVLVNEVFVNGRRLFSVFSHALLQVPESIYNLLNLHRTSDIEIHKYITRCWLTIGGLISYTFSSRWVSSLTKAG